MELTLSRIEFGATPEVPRGRALEAKRHYTAPVSSAWNAGDDGNSVVYAMPTDGRPPSIDVTLGTTAHAERRIWIRTRLEQPSSVLLGVLPPTPVVISPGAATASVTVSLVGASVGALGVSRSVVEWIWEWAEQESGEYLAFGRSVHRLYVILGPPQPPWQERDGGPGEAVWTDLLDWSCRWASGARTARDSAASICRRVNELGALGFTVYRRSESFRWTGQRKQAPFGPFRCTKFLELLDGESDDVLPQGNCTDMATIVVTFANALGCRLAIFRVSQPGALELNDFSLIGYDLEGTRKAMPAAGFEFHDLAGEGEGEQPAFVYDACVQLDADNRPGPPAFWTPAAGIPRTGAGSYERRFLTPQGRRRVQWNRDCPVELERPAPCTIPDRIAMARYERYVRMLGRRAEASASPQALDDYIIIGPIATRPVVTRFSGEVLEEVWTADPRNHSGGPLYFLVYSCGDRHSAMRVAAEVLAWCQPSFDLADPDGPPVLLACPRVLGGFTAREQAVIADGGIADVSAFVLALAVQMQ